MERVILDWNTYTEKARQASADGIVMLRNEDAVLPLPKKSKVSVFGRIAFHYYRSGTGSGGLVNAPYVTGILDALLEEKDLSLNKELIDIYRSWEKENPFEAGAGWGQEPWSQKEMPVTDEVCAAASKVSDYAIVIIGRTAGEDRDNADLPGAYRLTDVELNMMAKVRSHFDKMIVLLNVGNIIDMSFVDLYKPEAVLYVWQGGMTGGSGVADILTGRVCPSGRLTDTIVYDLSKVSASEFDDAEEDCYTEDIFVGYRYYCSVGEKTGFSNVRYPFGYGLSYTKFECAQINAYFTEDEAGLPVYHAEFSVQNTGERAGRHVLQIYASCPDGVLCKPAFELAAFAKTKEIKPGEIDVIRFEIPLVQLASFDDTGRTGYRYAYVLEKGEYRFFLGENVEVLVESGSVTLDETVPVKQCESALAPIEKFERIGKVQSGKIIMEDVPVSEADMNERMMQRVPEDMPMGREQAIKLTDIARELYESDPAMEGEYLPKDIEKRIDAFVAQLSAEELSCIIRGEGMGSRKVTPGTAAAFGGVTEALAEKGIPAMCCDDGPSGMRLDCGDKAFSLPNGTMLACTFDTELNRELFYYLGLEMRANKVDNLLGPGMNIHRHPLNGRNFEYFSEDPLLTGLIGTAQLAGLDDAGVCGTAKHFCANNQEKGRTGLDSVISERALREIYLKGFEIACRSGHLHSLMTTYGRVNGRHTASSYDLTETILRREWGFEGIVMTDWWAMMSEDKERPGSKSDFASMVRARNDLYMVCPDGSGEGWEDNTLEALDAGEITMGQLQRMAKDICVYALHSPAMKRLAGMEETIEQINRPFAEDDADGDAMKFYDVHADTVTSIKIEECEIDTSRGADFHFGIKFIDLDYYDFIFTGSAEGGDTVQIPVTLFFTAIPMGMMTWNGTGGKTETRTIPRFRATTRNSRLHLHFGQSGLKLERIDIVRSAEIKGDEIEESNHI